jgi:hypothetical protein
MPGSQGNGEWRVENGEWRMPGSFNAEAQRRRGAEMQRCRDAEAQVVWVMFKVGVWRCQTPAWRCPQPLPGAGEPPALQDSDGKVRAGTTNATNSTNRCGGRDVVYTSLPAKPRLPTESLRGRASPGFTCFVCWLRMAKNARSRVPQLSLSSGCEGTLFPRSPFG